MENSDSDSSVDQNSLASVINLFENAHRSTISASTVDSDLRNLSSSANLNLEGVSPSENNTSQYDDELEFASNFKISCVCEQNKNISEKICTNVFNRHLPKYVGCSKQSKSVQTSFKFKERFSSSQTSSVDLNISENPSTVFPIDVIANLHIPQYRPVPAHKLGIMSGDLSSTFPILNFTTKQQQEHPIHQEQSLVSSSSSALMVTPVVLSSTINTSLANQSAGIVNKCDYSLTQLCNNSSMRLILIDENQNYSPNNPRTYDYNKYFNEQTAIITDRNISSSEKSTATTFSHPGGDSGISNTSPDTYSLSEPGIAVSASQCPLENIDSYNQPQQRKTNIYSQTVQKISSRYNDDNKDKLTDKTDPYRILNQYLLINKHNTSENLYIPSVSSNHRRTELSYDASVYKIWQKYENRLYKFNQVTSSFSLSTSPSSSSTCTPSVTLSSSPSSSSSTPTNSSKSELFSVTVNRKFKEDSSDDDSTSDQRDEVQKGRIQNTQSPIAVLHLFGKKKQSNNKCLISDSDILSYQPQRK
ncbi:unnamed protein product [Schistosoma turkestanicum]|nr:unnamed protein product [Schistosoma turkestanicum]